MANSFVESGYENRIKGFWLLLILTSLLTVVMCATHVNL